MPRSRIGRDGILLLVVFCALQPSTEAWCQSQNDKPVPDKIPVLKPVVVTTSNPDPFSMTQRAPTSTSVLTKEDLRSNQLADVQDIVRNFSNFSMVEGGARSFNTIFGVRGLTSTQYFSDSPLAVYLDGIPLGKGFTQSAQLQQLRAAVLERGPQPSRYGQNSEAGVLLLKRKPASTKTEMDASASYGNYNAQKYRAALSTPLAPGLSLGISGYHDERDGFLFNETLGTHPDSQNSYGGSVHLDWNPSHDWEFSILSMQECGRDGEQRISSLAGDPFRVAHPVDGVTDINGNTTGFKATYHGEAMDVSSVTSYRWWKLDPYRVNFGFNPGPPMLQSIVIDQETIGQEMQISSPAADEDPLDWVAGLSFSHEDSKYRFGLDLPTLGLTSSANNMLSEDLYALFGNLSFPLIDRLKLSLGARVDYRDKSARSDVVTFPGSPIRASQQQGFFNAAPQAGLSFAWDPSLLLYANATGGFKSGGFIPFQGASQLRTFQTERVWTGDLGAKKSLLKDKLFLNGSFFYSRVERYQFERYISATEYTVINIPEVAIAGGEMEVLSTPIAGLETGVGMGWTSTRILRHTDPITGRDWAGQRAPYVPEYNLLTHLQYKDRSGFLGRIETQFMGESFFDEANSAFLRQAPYGLLHGRIGYETRHAGVYLFSRNLTDKLYYGFKSGALNAGTIGEPRTFGLEGCFSF